MKTKEEIALMWLVIIITGIITSLVFPEVLLLILVAYCGYNLYTHYNNKI